MLRPKSRDVFVKRHCAQVLLCYLRVMLIIVKNDDIMNLIW